MKIIYWENIISQHKVPYWNFLAKSDKVAQFILVVEQELSEDLKSQGWENGFESNAKSELIVNPSESKIIDLFKNNIEDSYHVFSGIRAIPMVFNAFKISLSFPVHRILLTERVNLYGIRILTRRFATLFIERKYKKHYDIVLGSGSKTKEWYLECGIKELNFFPFMYSVSYPKTVEIPLTIDKLVRFVFIGRLIKLKGLDVLFLALGKLSNMNWVLDIYGDCTDSENYVRQLHKLKIEKKVNFKGVKSNKEIIQILASYQTLILPSRRDGWGAVVNEAIASGVKVICSDRCGASILLVNPTIGSVFNINKTKELTSLLKSSIDSVENYDRPAILEYSEYLKGENVADYLIEILEYHYKKIGERPLPPWEKYLRDQRNKQSSF